MKRKSNFSKVLTVILSLAVAVGVFYLAFPKQAEDVTNWVTGLFQTKEPPIQEEPSLEESAPEDPEEPGENQPEEPSDSIPDTPDEPEEPVMKTAIVYVGDNNVGTIEIDVAVLEDAEALKTFWLENYDDNVRSQIDNETNYSLRVENTSTEDECAIKVSYYRVYILSESGSGNHIPGVYPSPEKMNSEFSAQITVLVGEDEGIDSNTVVLNGLEEDLNVEFIFDDFEVVGTFRLDTGWEEDEASENGGAFFIAWSVRSNDDVFILYTNIAVELYYNGIIEI